MTLQELLASTHRIHPIQQVPRTAIHLVDIVLSEAEDPHHPTGLMKSTVPALPALLIVTAVKGSSKDPYTVNLYFPHPGNAGTLRYNNKGKYVDLPRVTGHTPVQCRCTCMDFYMRMAEWDDQHEALYGDPFPRYHRKTTTRPEVNPGHIPGLCKHLVGTARYIQSLGILQMSFL
jgi:hypothetical protein